VTGSLAELTDDSIEVSIVIFISNGWPIAFFFTPLTPTNFYTLNITESANVIVMEKTEMEAIHGPRQTGRYHRMSPLPPCRTGSGCL
jgi:hypothetical protein